MSNEGGWEPWWYKMDWNDTSLLKDHYYYLVTVPHYDTPMKAKWHADPGLEHWEILGVKVGYGKYISVYAHQWDASDDHKVIAWMHLPEVYHEENGIQHHHIDSDNPFGATIKEEKQ